MTQRSVVSKLALLGLFAVPAALPVALVLRAEDDASIGPNFTLLGLLAGLIGGTVVTVQCIKNRCWPWRAPVAVWAIATLCNLAVVAVAGGLIDFGGFAGGGH